MTNPTPLPISTDPLDDQKLNQHFASLSSQLSKQCNTLTGSAEWCAYGDYPQSWGTGGHANEGWNHQPWLTQRRGQLLALANSMSRRRRWPNATKRKIGYGDGELPAELMTGWEPDGTPTGYQLVDGIKIWAFDCEHFNIGYPLSLAEMNPQETIEGLTWNGNPLPPIPIGNLANIEMQFIQDSICDQFKTWLDVKDAQNYSQRTSDRVVSRGTWAFIRSIPIVGCDGINQVMGDLWLDNVARWLSQGPHLQTSKISGTQPYVQLPYYNPVHSYGYMLPVVYWLLNNYGQYLKPGTRIAFEDFLMKGGSEIQRLVSADGATPWAVGKDNTGEVLGYFGPPNGDKYTPGYEVFTALHIAQRFKYEPKTAESIAAISARFQRNHVYGPWMCDAHFLPVPA